VTEINGSIPVPVPIQVKPLVFQLGNVNVDVVDFKHPDPNLNHALQICAQNFSLAYLIPIPDEVWDVIEAQIASRKSDLIIPTKGMPS
jgi:hypothetical protein